MDDLSIEDPCHSIVLKMFSWVFKEQITEPYVFENLIERPQYRWNFGCSIFIFLAYILSLQCYTPDPLKFLL